MSEKKSPYQSLRAALKRAGPGKLKGVVLPIGGPVRVRVHHPRLDEFYAHVGRTMQSVAALESAIANAMVVFDLLPEMPKRVGIKEWHRRYDQFMVKQHDLTMGKLINAIRRVSPLSDEIIEELRKAKAKRDWLVHHFFRERVQELISGPGMNEAIKELREMESLFDRTFDAFQKAMEPAYERVSDIRGLKL
jgi:hypothetical protein